MSVPEDDVSVVERHDDLSRQRQRRADRLLDRRVPGFGDLDVRSLIRQMLAVIEERGGPFDVQRFLVDHGHSRQTVETVLAKLGIAHATHPSHMAPRWGGRS